MEIMLRDMISHSLSEEHNDHDKYMEMAEMAKKSGKDCITGILEDIACEELTHAHLLQEILDMED